MYIKYYPKTFIRVPRNTIPLGIQRLISNESKLIPSFDSMLVQRCDAAGMYPVRFIVSRFSGYEIAAKFRMRFLNALMLLMSIFFQNALSFNPLCQCYMLDESICHFRGV